MKRSLLIFVLAFLTGCGSLLPKKVEFFQDKVKKFPEPSAKLVELERQAIYRASAATSDTVQSALLEGASTNVIAPAKDAKVLTEAVAVALGPPDSPSYNPAPLLALNLESAVAKHDDQVASFKRTNDKDVGKKIEGTGFFQISYVYWVGGIFVVVVVVLVLGKLALTAASVANPGAAVGLNVVNAAEGVVSKGFTQLVKGGEDFKSWVGTEIADSGLKTKILNAFATAHQKAQDSDVQNTVAALTK